MMKHRKEILERARAIVADAWTDKGKAINAAGELTLPYAEDAVAWNSSGAIYKAVGNDLGTVFPLRHLANACPEGVTLDDPDRLLDRLGLEAVLQTYDRAIAGL